MLKTSSFVTVVASLVLSAAGVGATPANKCVVNGKVTFQQGPCGSDQVRKRPTLEELNAEEKRRRAAAATAATAAPAAPAATAAPGKEPAPAAPATSSGFSCDGRQYCSQMKSCAEAKYFLAKCPNVKMDGDKDGIPCEEQWCSH